MISDLKSWWEFGLFLIGDAASLKDAIRLYPVGCAFGIYWTQGIKRAQKQKKWRNRENLTRLELRALSGCIAGVIITLMAVAFFPEMPKRQILAHTILGGAAAPMIMWAVIESLQLAGRWFPWAADYCQRVKTGDRRRSDEGRPPPGVEDRRLQDETGEFWTNDR